jgi:hypothetical protein
VKTHLAIIVAGIILISSTYSAYAQEIPTWVKNNAAWWAEGAISESDFVKGIQFLIKENVLTVPQTSVSGEKSNGVPGWVKNNAAWWSEGIISDTEFINAIQHLIKTGVISVSAETAVQEKKAATATSSLDSELEKCKEITKAYDRLNCERAVKAKIALADYKQNAEKFVVGPVTFYWKGVNSEGNDFEITDSGQAILNIRMLAENTGSGDNVSLFCTGPAVCNYDIWNGDKAFKYSGMDFTNGQIVLKPGESKEFNMLFGPNIGYGGTKFEYDSSKDYFFRISESWGSASIPLNLE